MTGPGQAPGGSRGTDPGPLPPLARGRVWGSAVLAVGLLLLTATRYGYHRDELYFLEASRHMAWGYVDQPPLSVAFVWLARVAFGHSLVGLRLFPALADGMTVVVTGLLARELGGRRFAQGLASLAVAIGPFLIAGHLAGPTMYDILLWAVVSLVFIRIVRTGEPWLWVALGATVGVALMAKETILFLLVGLAVGLVANRQWGMLRGPWPWLGLGLALLIWSPNLVWEFAHRWPTLKMSRNLRREHSGLGVSLTFPLIQLLLPGWWVAPVWIAGLVGLWRERHLRSFRAFAVAYGFLFVVVGVTLGDRPYYLGGLYPVLLATGAPVAEGVVDGTRRFLSERLPARRLIWRSKRAAVGFVVFFGATGLPLSLPVLPASALATVPLQDVNYNLGETIGWQELVATVAQVYRSLPAPDQALTSIVTANYGEAGAIDRYGPALGLPPAFSGHNSYWWWGPPTPPIGVTIAVGLASHQLEPYFDSVRRVATVRNSQGVSNDEEGAPVWLCAGQRAPWPRIWAAFRHYG